MFSEGLRKQTISEKLRNKRHYRKSWLRLMHGYYNANEISHNVIYTSKQ